MADNFHFNITGGSLTRALEIATQQWDKVVGWSLDKDSKRLILYWAHAKYTDFNPLPAALEGEAIVLFVEAWLKTVDYESEPDHDGDNKKGATVYNEGWTQVDGRWEAFIAIEPTWMMYGK